MNSSKSNSGIYSKWARLLTLTFFSPPLAAAQEMLHACRQLGWKRPLIGLSVLGNVLLVLLFVLAILDAEPTNVNAIPKSLIQYSDCGIRLAVAPDPSELHRLYPGAIYAVASGKVIARFEPALDGQDVFNDASVLDNHERPFVHVDLADGTFIYERYGDPEAIEPDYSFRDEDADGIPDLKVSWRLGKRFRRANEIEWVQVTND
jgi:hypothetical protein